MKIILGLSLLSFVFLGCENKAKVDKINKYQASYEGFQKICLKELYQLSSNPEIKNFDFNKSPVSKWPGVVKVNQYDHITELSLEKAGINGDLPACLKNLRSLQLANKKKVTKQ